jgi:hypothetical protein
MWCSVLFAVLASVVAVVAQDPVSVDDSDNSIVYASPRGSWTRHRDQAASFGLYQNSDTFIDVQGATITWKFRGTHVEYWGNTGSYHGPCRVTIDGGNDETVSSNAAQTGPPILLYQRSNLDPATEHTIVITVVDPEFPNVCELDRFVYIPVDTDTDTTPTPTGTSTRPSSTSSGGGSSNGGGSGNNSSANSTKSSPPWGVIGGAIGGGLGGGILLAVALYWWCRRQKNREDLEDIIVQETTAPVIASSKPQSPFAPRPLSNEQSMYSNKPQMATSTRPPSTAYTASVYPTSAATTDGQFNPTSLMPIAHQDGSSMRTSTYGSESSYGPTSPALSTHSSRPLMLHNPSQSSTGSVGLLGHGAAPSVSTAPLVPGRRPAVLSATSEFGEGAGVVAATAAGSSSTPAPPRDEKRTILSAESASGASSSARPVVQHTDAGVVPTSAPAAVRPEELPPAYNDQWSGQQR